MRYNAAQFEKRAKIWICILDFARFIYYNKVPNGPWVFDTPSGWGLTRGF